MKSHIIGIKQPDTTDLKEAVAMLAHTERGRKALRSILNFIRDGGDGLDELNQSAVIMLFRCQFGPFAGSTREEIKRAIGAQPSGTVIAQALDACQAFVSGFEGDESQEEGSIERLLAKIAKAQTAL